MKIEKRAYYYYNGKPYETKDEVLQYVIADKILELSFNLEKDYSSLIRRLCINSEFRQKFKDCLINMEDLEFDE